MEVFDYKGICLKRDKRAIYLDPSSGRPDGAVSHAATAVANLDI